MSFRQSINCSVEYEVLGAFLHQLGITKLLHAWLTFGGGGVNFSLYHVILAIHGRESPFWFDQDQSIHAIGDVFSNHRSAAVIDKEPRRGRLKSKGLRLPGNCLGKSSAPTWTEGRMEVNRVCHVAVGSVAQRDFHRVTLPDPYHRAWN